MYGSFFILIHLLNKDSGYSFCLLLIFDDFIFHIYCNCFLALAASSLFGMLFFFSFSPKNMLIFKNDFCHCAETTLHYYIVSRT